MGISIAVDSQNFATDVVQQSFDKPVLVDFYATWCGPCQMLKPMLEKLAREYDIVVAKVDIDQNPDLANAHRVEGVPDVRIVLNGEIMPGFVGVLPEPQLRQLLAQMNLKSNLELGFESIRAAQATGDVERARRLFGELIQQYPEDRRLLLEAAQFLLGQNSLESAEKLVNAVQMPEREFFPKAQAIKTLIQWKRELTEGGAIASESATDLDRQYTQSVQAALATDYETALQGFLTLVERDRKYRQDGARKAMLTLFDLLGDDHPLTQRYRKQLMLVLY